MNVDERAEELLDAWCEGTDTDESSPAWYALCLWAYAIAWCENGNHLKASQFATMAIAAWLLSPIGARHRHYVPEI